MRPRTTTAIMSRTFGSGMLAGRTPEPGTEGVPVTAEATSPTTLSVTCTEGTGRLEGTVLDADADGEMAELPSVMALKALMVETESVGSPLAVLGSLAPPSKLRALGESEIRESDDGGLVGWAEVLADEPPGAGVSVFPSGAGLPAGFDPTGPGATLTPGGLSATATAAKEGRVDGFVSPVADTFDPGPAASAELPGPGVVGVGLAAGPPDAGLLDTVVDGIELPGMVARGEIAAA
jgi:hypothetical protein